MEAEHDPIVQAFLSEDGHVPTPALPAPENAVIDRMVREQGLRALLSAITQYCYARSMDELADSFEEIEACEDWRRAARVVEIATINERVNLK